MKVLLWLDDVRNPFLNEEGKLPEFTGTIEWVRNFAELKAWLYENKLPDIVSFDHDLADEHYTPEFFWNDYELSKKYQEWRESFYREATGQDCARYLKAFCKSIHKPLPEIHVHSDNPVGRDKILEILKQ